MKQFIIGLGLLAISAPAFADDAVVETAAPVSTEVGLFVGGFVSNYYNQLYDTNLYPGLPPQLDQVSPQVGARFSHFFGAYLGAEAEGSAAFAGVDGHSGATILGLQAQVVLQYPGAITPFFDAGAGLWHVESDLSSLGRTTIWPLHIGIGARWYITDKLALRVDGKLYRGPSSKDPYTLDATYGDFSIGISYVLGRQTAAVIVDPDPDHDGVFGAADHCPNEPANTPDGCPDPDRDHDGIPNAQDKCPDQSETINGYQDADGCPDEVPDSDHDGINDVKDKCPNDPEDKDGYQDEDGCPDPDNDNDGVTDAVDKCPNEKGPVENHGCPDVDTDGDGIVDRLDNCPTEPGTAANHGCKAKQLVVITQTQIKILDQVRFQTGTARLSPASHHLLDNVAHVLIAHPEIKRIKVEGFTDNVGKREMNQKLSDDRAQSVTAYLVKAGVASDRLESLGHGEDSPIEDNKTAKGRAANRRVEFNIAPAAP